MILAGMHGAHCYPGAVRGGRARRPARHRGLGAGPVAVGALVALLGLGACTGSPSDGGTPGVSWWAEASPPGVDLVTIAEVGGRLVAGAAGQRPATAPVSTDSVHAAGEGTAVVPELYVRESVLPAASTSGEPSPWRALPVRAESPYGRVATWLSVQPDARGDLVAVGGARGGAHANVRWTVWRGSVTTGLQEQEQSFLTFGGWGAGDQLGVLQTGAGPMLLGTWESAASGLDGAIWLPQGQRWVRRDSTGTALASTRTELVGPVGGTGWGGGALVVGSLVQLTDGVREMPAAWRSVRADEGWAVVALPTPQPGQALGAVCRPEPAAAADGSGCVVVGRVGGRFAAWRVRSDATAAPLLVPDFLVAERDPMAPPVWLPGRPDTSGVLAGAAAVLVTRAGGDRCELLVADADGGWQVLPGPPGVAVALVVSGGRLWALTRVSPSSGGMRLWSTMVPSGSRS